MEFALKQCRLLRSVTKGDVAQIDQSRLTRNLGAGFFSAVQAMHVAETLIASPPKHFVVNEIGDVGFGDQPTQVTNTSDLIGATWRVRNNLFHGNKMFPTDRERDQRLMTDALAVLNLILEKIPDISSAFHEPQQFFQHPSKLRK